MERYINYLLHREQLHVSALDNGHLQAVYETVNSYTKHIYGLLMWGKEGVKWAQDIVPVPKVGWCGLHGGSMQPTPSNL